MRQVYLAFIFRLLILKSRHRRLTASTNEHIPSSLGTVHFYERGGAGGIWGGGHAKKNGFRGGAIPKKIGKKGGPREIF